MAEARLRPAFLPACHAFEKFEKFGSLFFVVRRSPSPLYGLPSRHRMESLFWSSRTLSFWAAASSDRRRFGLMVFVRRSPLHVRRSHQNPSCCSRSCYSRFFEFFPGDRRLSRSLLWRSSSSAAEKFVAEVVMSKAMKSRRYQEVMNL